MKIIYIADNGKQFNDEYECMEYEWKLNHPHLKNIKFLDKNGNKVSGDLFSLEFYGNTEKIIVKTQEEVNDLIELGSYTGHCAFEDVDSPGIWMFNDDPYICTFEKVEEKIEEI